MNTGIRFVSKKEKKKMRQDLLRFDKDQYFLEMFLRVNVSEEDKQINTYLEFNLFNREKAEVFYSSDDHVSFYVEENQEIFEYWEFCKENISKIVEKGRFPTFREMRKDEF